MLCERPVMNSAFINLVSAASEPRAAVSGPELNPDDFEHLARQLGQNDPQERRWSGHANDNGPGEPASRGTLFLAFAVGSLLAAVVIVWLWG
jgi:hypothetical protein